ncbi:F-box/kelch-repeat protein At3g23880-like [Silene latifolia]|uniref:F-box/kelch-repeat protein At3g23880-like n=1 Tax=Silene latifolia TaxID=37657 RepID=UPI003D76AFA1
MEKTKKTITLLKSKYIPPELLTLIFAPLPVKTLVRFRCVCKYWCSIIDHPDFVSMHYKLCKSNIDSKKLLAFERLGLGGDEGCLLTVRQSNRLGKSAQIFKSSKDYSLFGKCNGLLLMYYSSYQLRLWNPSIRKSLAIPSCPLSYNWSHHVVYLFGYANDSKDYKIIAISFEKDESSTKKPVRNTWVAVYTLNDKKWRLRNNHDLNISCWYFTCMFPYNSYQTTASNALIFQGAAYWIGNDPNNPDIDSYYESTHLISLDFDLEKFTYLELPFALEKNSGFMLRLGESLAVFNPLDVTAPLWVMEQENKTGAWSRWFSGPLSWDYCEFFDEPTETPVFYYEHFRKLGRQMSSYSDLDTYLESLVLCKGYGAEDLTSFP